jgi:hypothetical protein
MSVLPTAAGGGATPWGWTRGVVEPLVGVIRCFQLSQTCPTGRETPVK